MFLYELLITRINDFFLKEHNCTLDMPLVVT